MHVHIESLIRRHTVLAECVDSIEQAFMLIRDSLRAEGTLFPAGVGGSAADADHWSAKLLKGFCKKRPLGAADQACMRPEIANRLQGGLRALALTGSIAFTTGFSNDVSPDLAWAQLVHKLGRAGDVFIGLSTSGNAPDVCMATETAHAKA